MKTLTNDDIRHSILQILYRKTNNQQYVPNTRQIFDWCVPIEDVSLELFNNRDKIKQCSSLMWTKQEIGVAWYDEKECLYIKQAGIVSHNEEFYKKVNLVKFNDRAYNLTKWLIPLILGLIAIATTCKSIIDEKANKDTIHTLQQKVDSLLNKRTV